MVWKCCSTLKEFSGNLHFDTFFHLRGVSLQGGSQGKARLSGHQFTCPPRKALLFSTKPLGGPTGMGKSEQMSAQNSTTPSAWWGSRGTRFTVTSFKLLFRNMWLRMTLNFTQHKREMGFKLDLLFWVVSLFSP